MTLTRRMMMTGAAALLSGCGASRRPAVTQGAPFTETTLPQVANPGWDDWVAAFRPRALDRGISGATFDAAFRNAGFTPGVIERDRNQTEYTRTLQDYLALLVSEEQVANGRAAMARHASALQAIEGRYGVPPHVTAAVWGVETRYGTRRGNIPVISATSTLAYDGRRAQFFTDQCLAALRILESGDITPDRMTGSWAGAMGHTQFIPTSYLSLAVDFTGDGRRDIWGDDPTDALASTAAYLANAGWRSGALWGVEVATDLTGGRQSVAEWTAAGVRPAAGGDLPDHGTADLIRPQGAGGPAFLIWRNYTVISRYNDAQNYIIAVGHLSDRLRGGGPLRGSFPPDAQGLTLADRQDIQRRLTAAGFDTQGSDGVIGRNTIAAIEAFEASRGLPVTGQATRALLEALR